MLFAVLHAHQRQVGTICAQRQIRRCANEGLSVKLGV